MDLMYDFSAAKVSSDALSSRYQKSGGRSRLWLSVQRDVKKKQNKMEKDSEKVSPLFHVSYLIIPPSKRS